MPLVAPPIQVNEMQLRVMRPSEDENLPGRPIEQQGRWSRPVSQNRHGLVHETPGRAQDDIQLRPRVVWSAAWPLAKGLVRKHPGHPDQLVHDPKRRRQVARERTRAVVPLKYERKSFTPAQRKKVLGDDPRCVWCKYESGAGTPEDRRREFEVDHIIAVSKGGTNERLSALRPACKLCNSARGNKPVSRWREWVFRSRWLRMNREERQHATRDEMTEAMRRLRAVA